MCKDQLLRKAAEFENYKRRVEIDQINFVKTANESLIGLLLPVLDDLTRSLKLGKEQKNYDAFFKGVELIQNKFMQVLETRGSRRLIRSASRSMWIYMMLCCKSRARTSHRAPSSRKWSGGTGFTIGS